MNKTKTVGLQIISIDIDQFYYVSNVQIANGTVITLPVELFSLNLRYLNLYNNGIKILPKEIGNCIGFTDLDISSNKLIILPKEIENCINLERLHIMYNMLKMLPKEIFNLKRLSKIYINYN